MKRKLISLICAVLCILLLAQTAMAATTDLSVTVKVKGNVPTKAEAFMVELKADDTAFPMPDGSTDGVFQMEVKGGTTASLPHIDFNRVGVYTYTVRQLKGENPKCTYDTTVYHLKVTVTNNVEGTDLELTVVARADDTDDKVDMEFTNSYAYEPSDTPQTNDESNFPLYATLAAGSILVLVALFLTRKRKEDTV